MLGKQRLYSSEAFLLRLTEILRLADPLLYKIPGFDNNHNTALRVVLAKSIE
jgi:hypothetical protein